MVHAPVCAQQEEARPALVGPKTDEPADDYFKGYLLAQDAEKLAEQRRYPNSLEKYQQAQQIFDRLRRDFPDWRKDMVDARVKKNQAAIDAVVPAMLDTSITGLIQKAEDSQSMDDGVQALAWYREALKRADHLKELYPEWHKDAVAARIARTREAIEQLAPKE